MKQVLLDTSFIITCIKQKIDFFNDIVFMSFEILIPQQVIEELKRLSKSNSNAKIALKLLEKNRFKKINLQLKNVDRGIIKYAEKHQELIIATLDREIKKEIQNQKLVIRGKTRIEMS